MQAPLKLIQVLAEQTSTETLNCHYCEGRGEVRCFNSETGSNHEECAECLGTGYNQLGLIIQGILKPPKEGYGAVALQAAIEKYNDTMAVKSMLKEATNAIEQEQQEVQALQKIDEV